MRRTVTSIACFCACIFILSAHASILSATGSGELGTVGDSISGHFEFEKGTIDYTLTLKTVSNFRELYWHGGFRSSASPQPGFEWWDGDTSWSAELSFSRSVQLLFAQVDGHSGGANEDFSAWTVDWNTDGVPTITDPDDQLEDETIGAGTAAFSIRPSRLYNSQESWRVSGPASDRFTISWVNETGGAVGTDWFGVFDGTALVIPEPSGITVLGGAVLISLGFYRRRQDRSV